MDITWLAIISIVYIFPAYAANFSAALFGGGLPLDLNRKFRDGRRVFGDGKTFRGLMCGIFLGTVAGAVEGNFIAMTEFAFADINFTLFSFLLATGALCGDLVASFFKRRMGYRPGQLLPIVDQLDFVAGAALFGSLMYVPTAGMAIFLIVITPIIHLLLNLIGYLLRLKKVPW